jgi:hypothetical protein
MASLVQILAALLVLAAFVLVQARVLTPRRRAYLVLNTVGAGVLALDAYAHGQWGFLLLEGVWAMVSAAALLRSSSARRGRPA